MAMLDPSRGGGFNSFVFEQPAFFALGVDTLGVHFFLGEIEPGGSHPRAAAWAALAGPQPQPADGSSSFQSGGPDAPCAGESPRSCGWTT